MKDLIGTRCALSALRCRNRISCFPGVSPQEVPEVESIDFLLPGKPIDYAAFVILRY